MSTTNIYVLRLEGGKYYVGKTDNLTKRIEEHFDGNGSAWTRKYKPVSIVEKRVNVSSFEEDKYTKEYMSKYGIDNVRGGSYAQINLDQVQKEALTRELRGAEDLCAKCGREGHFVSNCYAKTEVSGKKIVLEEEDEEDEDEDEEEWECEYCERRFTTAFGCGVHEKSCKEKLTIKVKNGKKENACYRCGNTGHYSPDCYATRHVKGYYLD